MGQPPVNTWLVTGFLGAGKTTFIKSRLKADGYKTAVLVNEFSSLGMDGEAIREDGPLKVVEIPSGCICCSHQEKFADAVQEIVTRVRPDRLLIEPSGVAEASAVIKGLAPQIDAGDIRLESVIAIVDAATVLEDIQPGVFGTFFVDQLTHADAILINKIDLVSPGVTDEIKRAISAINPAALTVPTAFASADLHPPPGPRRPLEEHDLPLLHFDVLSLAPERAIPAGRLAALAAKLKGGDFGSIWRAKGIVETTEGTVRSLQYARGEVILEDRQCRLPARLTVIGSAIDRAKIERFLSGPDAQVQTLRKKGNRQ